MISRRAQFELARAQKRSHVVDGLIAAQQKLDRVVATIRAASDGPAASQELQTEFGLSPEQVSARTEAPTPSHVSSRVAPLTCRPALPHVVVSRNTGCCPLWRAA